MRDAVAAARRDWERICYAHAVTWSLDLHGRVEWCCSCSPGSIRNAAAIDEHILTEIRRIRGPERKRR